MGESHRLQQPAAFLLACVRRTFSARTIYRSTETVGLCIDSDGRPYLRLTCPPMEMRYQLLMLPIPATAQTHQQRLPPSSNHGAIVQLLAVPSRHNLCIGCPKRASCGANLQKDMGFSARNYLRLDAMPSLSLPSEPNLEEVEEETLPKITASAREAIDEVQRQAPLRQYGRRRPRGSVTTQTAYHQCTVGVQAFTLVVGRNVGVQACSFNLTVGTQTEVQPAAMCTVQNAASSSDPMCGCGALEPCHCSSLTKGCE
ncbi:hypothetical protein MRX96_014018 [Rhipicephalus microplus]